MGRNKIKITKIQSEKDRKVSFSINGLDYILQKKKRPV